MFHIRHKFVPVNAKSIFEQKIISFVIGQKIRCKVVILVKDLDRLLGSISDKLCNTLSNRRFSTSRAARNED